MAVVISAHAGIQYAAAYRFHHCRLWNIGSPLSRVMTVEGVAQFRDLAAQFARGLLSISLPSDQRAQGMPGARCARSRAWCVESTRVSHHGHTGKRPAFPAQWF
jgi:hypothetical protein